MKNTKTIARRKPSTTLTKQQVASKYGVSTKTLRNWINGNTDLVQELTKTGYNKFTKVFTVFQIKLITNYLGNF